MTTNMISFALFVTITLVVIASNMITEAIRTRLEKSAQETEMRSHIENHTNICEPCICDQKIEEDGILDLAFFSKIWDSDQLAIFFEEHSKLFPGQQTILLPLEKLGTILVSQPKQTEVQRLTRMLLRADRVQFSIQLLVDNQIRCDSRLTTIFLV